MIPLSLLAFAQLLFWDQGTETAATLRQHGVTAIAAPPERAAAWRQAGFTVVALSPEERQARVALDPPGVNQQITVASPTQRPWLDASGWRFRRQGASARYRYELPAGTAALAAAEAHLFGADAVLQIDPSDLPALGKTLALLRTVPAPPWPDLAQIEVVDDGSDLVGDVMNLLSRRNLLWRPKGKREGKGAGTGEGAGGEGDPAVTVRIGSATFPKKAARDPSELARQIRRMIGDDRRLLRVYGSEVVLCRLQGAPGQLRLSLLNYGNGVREGVRVRLRGAYPRGTAVTDRTGSRAPIDQVPTGDATELTVPPFALWAVVDLQR